MATTQALTLRDDNAVATRSTQISDVQRLGNLLAASGYFSDAREMAQAAVKVMAGEELGIPPVAAMMGINIIKGKIALGGNLIASRIRAHGFDFIHKQFDATGCVLIFLGRKGEEDRGHGMLAGRPILGESSFNEADAKAAQIGSEMYKKFPRNMYFNRAISNGAKWYTPEVFAGAPVYVPEELGATVDDNGDMVHPEPTKEEQTAARKAAMDRKLAEIRQAAPTITTEPVAQEDTTPSTLDQLLETFGAKANIVRAYEQMREHFCTVLDASVFDQILAEHQITANPWQFGSIGTAKKCFRALWGAYHKAMAELPTRDEEPAE